MNRLVARPWLIMALIFLVGIATGVLLMIGLGPLVTTPPGAQEMRNRWMMHLTHRLNLTTDQQAKIQPIVTEAELQIQSAHREDLGRISGIMEAANTKISALLNSDQKQELQSMERERVRMFHMHDMHRPGGDFPGHSPGPPPNGP